MMITNMVKNPVANITTSPNGEATLEATILCNPLMAGVSYQVSIYVNVRGGTVSLNSQTIDKSMRVSWAQVMTVTQTRFPLGFVVRSGTPTVTVTSMLICTLDEYRANKTLLDSIKYFTGDTMPLA